MPKSKPTRKPPRKPTRKPKLPFNELVPRLAPFEDVKRNSDSSHPSARERFLLHQKRRTGADVR